MNYRTSIPVGFRVQGSTPSPGGACPVSSRGSLHMEDDIRISKEGGHSHAYQVKRVLYIVVFLSVCVALLKLGYGIFSSSEAMQADGLDSLFDSIGGIIGIIAMGMASKPADDDHPYGHGKFETTASLIVGVILLFGAYRIASAAVDELISLDYDVEVTAMSYVVMAISIAAKIVITTYERRMGKKLNSEMLTADAANTLADVLVSSGVVLGLILSQLGYPMADPIVSLAISVVVLFTAINIFRTGNETLSDHARIPEGEIHDIVDGFADRGICNCHKVRTRGTPSEVYVDLHVLVAPDMSVFEAHSIGKDIVSAICSAYPQVVDATVHFEPDTPEEREKALNGDVPDID